MADKVKVSCTNCGKTNYYPRDPKGKSVVCGHCKTALPEPGRIVEPSPSQAYNLFQKSAIPVLADFFSPTCGPCQMMHPILENLAMRRVGELMVVKINVDSHPEMAAAFGVQGVPTMIILRRGNEVARTSGALDETNFSLWVASLV
ncbi:thioredoxin family protein [Acidobacteriota bacterium]